MAKKKNQKQQDDPVTVEPPSDPSAWWHNPPTDLESATMMLERRAFMLKSDSEEGHALRKLLQFVERAYEEMHEQIKKEHPLAFFKPSYEQTLLLNAWIWGINYPVCFSANRIGKTTASVINALLWLLPNNPDWQCFQPYTDHLGRPVQLLPRPLLSDIKKIQNYLKDNPEFIGDPMKSHLESPNSEKFAVLQNLTQTAFPHPPLYDSVQNGTIWLGAPDNDFHREIILKEWKRWTPKQHIAKWSDAELYFHLSTKESVNPTPMIWEIYCKSYESEDTKWSGSAVYATILTEGLPLSVFKEVSLRIKDGGFAFWDYTPYEARNTGQKTKLAHDVYTGKEQLPLKAHIFTKFSARNAPEHILPHNKLQDMIRTYEGKKEGEARLDGDFYSTSPLILSRLDRKFHTVPWSREELFDLYPTGQIYRGFDPGYDHPSVCVWALLTPGDIWFIYRYYVERGRTIPERCKDIITLSGNVQQQFKLPNSNQLLFREMHTTKNSEVAVLTAADFHLFKNDEVSGVPYVNNYHREGLILTESTHMRPKDRAMEFDRKLTPNNFITHPLTKRTPGARVFFLLNETGVDQALQKMESLFWERLASGPNKGEAKDEVPSHGDDELDATCYLVSAPYCWTSYRPKPNNHFLEQQEELTVANLQQYNR